MPGPARPDRAATCRAAATARAELVGGRGVSAPAVRAAAALEAHEPPEARGLAPRRRPPARRRPRRPARSSTPASAICRSSSTPATCSSSTPRRRCPPRSPRAGAGGPAVQLHLSTPASRPSAAAGSSSCATGDAADRARDAPLGARIAAARRRRTPSSLAPYSRRDRLWVARLDAAAARCSSATSPVTASRSATATSPGDGRSTPTRTSSRRARQRRDAERRPAVHRGARDASSSRAGVGVAPLVLHAGVSSLEARRAPLPRALPRAARRPRGSSTPCTAGAAAWSPSAPPSSALWRRSPTPDGAVAAGEGWTDLVVTPERGLRAVDGLITGWHEPEARTSTARRGRRAASCSPLLPRGRAARLPLARVRRRPSDLRMRITPHIVVRDAAGAAEWYAMRSAPRSATGSRCPGASSCSRVPLRRLHGDDRRRVPRAGILSPLSIGGTSTC